jgi:hypothetical protein
MPQHRLYEYARYVGLAWLILLAFGALYAVVSGQDAPRARYAPIQQPQRLPAVSRASAEAPIPATDSTHGNPHANPHGQLHGNPHGGAPGQRTSFHGGAIPQDAPLMQQTAEQAHAKSHGCITCHTDVGDMHNVDTVRLGCVDCHGGDPNATTKDCAHVKPRFAAAWFSSANPLRSYTLLNHEDPDFIRFVNPGDLRVAETACGQCHGYEVLAVKKSMMTHGCMLWGAALYNNGAVPDKAARFGESYSTHGAPQRINNVPAPTEQQMREEAMLPYLDPLPRFEVQQPGNVLRIFERGGRFRPEVGVPERL